jgi:hypothetical protein
MLKVKNFVYLLFTFLFIVSSYVSCTTDMLEEPKPNEDCQNYDATYDGAIKPIIDATCAIIGCHVNGGGAPGNFSDYSGMTNYLNDSDMRESVVLLRNDPENGMPPNWDTNPGPKDLTDEQFELMECWINNGYPEN